MFARSMFQLQNASLNRNLWMPRYFNLGHPARSFRFDCRLRPPAKIGRRTMLFFQILSHQIGVLPNHC